MGSPVGQQHLLPLGKREKLEVNEKSSSVQKIVKGKNVCVMESAESEKMADSVFKLRVRRVVELVVAKGNSEMGWVMI
ncbi:hypothetical protein ACH3XW_17605 [Acanthocheilonema viteae]